MSMMKWLDQWTQSSARHLAHHTSRRSMLRKIGLGLVGAASIPLLPVARAEASREPPPDESHLPGNLGDPTKCEYWRNCATDGFLCSCCGGTQVSCPPGTEMSPITWIGTCLNPGDGREYLISYNDCCGKSTCNRCFCGRDEEDMPNYYPVRTNDIVWCMGTSNNVYHCTTTIVVGVATESQPLKSRFE